MASLKAAVNTPPKPLKRMTRKGVKAQPAKAPKKDCQVTRSRMAIR
jgi:hypothetical protein